MSNALDNVLTTEASVRRFLGQALSWVRWIVIAATFAPGSITVPRGTKVVWQNEDIYPHTVTDNPAKEQAGARAVLPDGAAAWDSGDVYPGQTWAYVFVTPGKYVYFSTRNEGGLMMGTVIVTE